MKRYSTQLNAIALGMVAAGTGGTVGCATGSESTFGAPLRQPVLLRRDAANSRTLRWEGMPKHERGGTAVLLRRSHLN